MTTTGPDRAAGDNPMLGSWWLPDAMAVETSLRRWVAERLGSGVVIRSCRFPDGGFSSVNVRFDLAGRDAEGRDVTGGYVARSAPPADVYPMFPQTDLVLQKRCMDLVGAVTDAPVPAVPWHETSPEWLGAEFLVMTRSAGRPWPSNPPYTCDGWVFELPAAARLAMQDGAVTAVAQLHAAAADRCDLGFLDRSELGVDAVDQYVGYLRGFYAWAAEGRSYPVVERAIDWLDTHHPAVTGPMVLNWGDARPGNLLFDGTAVAAVLDWEMAAAGPREVDLGFLVLFHKYFQLRAEEAGLAGLPELFRAADVVARYAELTGHRPADLRWFELLAATRIAIHHVRQLGRALHFGRLSVEEAADGRRIVATPLVDDLIGSG